MQATDTTYPSLFGLDENGRVWFKRIRDERWTPETDQVVEEYPLCRRCGIGIDSDKDGNCGACAKLTDAEVFAIHRARKGIFK